MGHSIQSILQAGAGIVPPRRVAAVAWLLCGLRNQSEIASLCGVTRQRLHDSPEFEDFRREYRRLNQPVTHEVQ